MNLLDSLFGAFVLLAIVACLYSLTGTLNRDREADLASWQIQTVAKAAEQWVRDNRMTLLNDEAFTMENGRQLTIAELKTGGYLVGGFPESSVWGQPFEIHLRRASNDASSQMHATVQIISAAKNVPDRHGWNGSEGSRIDFIREKPLEAALRTKGCGYIPSASLRTIYGIGEHTLYGPKTQWTLDLADVHGIESLGEGTYAIVSGYAASDGGLKSDYIYRTAVDGHPEVNRMETSLDMNGHVVAKLSAMQLKPIGENRFYFNGSLRTADNIGDLCSESGTEGLVFLDSEKGIYSCRNGALTLLHDTQNSVQVKSMDIVENGALVDKPACPAGLEAHIYAAAVSTAESTSATPIQAFQTWAEEQSSTQWKVRHRLTTTGSGQTEPSGAFVRILAVTTCTDPNMSY